MAHNLSPLAPKSYPDLPDIAGVRFATAEAGIKYKNRTDVLLAAFDEGTTVAGVFTRSKCPSAPVDFCRTNLKGGKARGLLVNSGNANAFTGMRGIDTVQRSAEIVSAALDVAPDETETLVNDGFLRASHRASHERPTPVEPDAPVDYRIDVRPQHHRFAEGHRVRLRLSGGPSSMLVPIDPAVDVTVHPGPGTSLRLPGFAAELP